MRFDLHVHSKYSHDGILFPEEIVKISIKKGLNGIAITDHNTIEGGLKAKEYETKDFRVIIGSEIMTDRGEIIGLFLEKEIDKSGTLYDVISEIKDQNGIVVIPHPFDELRNSAFHPTKDDVDFIDCIEGFNSRCVLKKYNDSAVEFGTKYDLAMTAGSDAHFSNEIGNAGVIIEKEDIREALIKREVNIFGNRTAIVNHARTKFLKLKRNYIKKGLK